MGRIIDKLLFRKKGATKPYVKIYPEDKLGKHPVLKGELTVNNQEYCLGKVVLPSGKIHKINAGHISMLGGWNTEPSVAELSVLDTDGKTYTVDYIYKK